MKACAVQAFSINVAKSTYCHWFTVVRLGGLSAVLLIHPLNIKVKKVFIAPPIKCACTVL